MFSSYISAIDRVFAYLNKYFCTMNERETTNVLGIRKFHAIVLNNEDVQKHVIKYVNQKVRHDEMCLYTGRFEMLPKWHGVYREFGSSTRLC